MGGAAGEEEEAGEEEGVGGEGGVFSIAVFDLAAEAYW